MRVALRFEGEAMTELLRALMREGNERKAWRLLYAAIPTAASHFVALLEGRTRLTGSSAWSIEDDETEAGATYRAAIEAQYAGRVLLPAGWYRVCGYVGAVPAWAKQQALAETRYEDDDDDDPQALLGRVSLQAAAIAVGSAYRVEPCPVAGTLRYVVLERAAEPPMWRQTTTSVAEAVTQYERTVGPLREQTLQPEPRVSAAERIRRSLNTEAPALLENRLPAAASETSETSERFPAATVARWRKEIRDAAAGGGWLDLYDEDGRTLMATVPRVPFLRWALRTSDWTPEDFERAGLAWKAVCPMGIRLFGDSQSHSDWYVGAGLDPNEPYDYDGAFHRRAETYRQQAYAEYTSRRAMLVVRGNPETRLIRGRVGREVLVVPALSPDRLAGLAGAQVVLTEHGGAFAHLAQEASSRGVPVLRVESCCALYPPGTSVVVDVPNGTILRAQPEA